MDRLVDQMGGMFGGDGGSTAMQDAAQFFEGADGAGADTLNMLAGGHGRIGPADGSAALAIARALGTHIHNSISISTTALVAFLAWQRQSLTPLAVLAIGVLAVPQVFPIWPVWFGLYLGFFIVTSFLAPVQAPRRTSAGFVIASTLLPTVLHSIFTLMLPNRMQTVSLFLLASDPPICLPRPSQTFSFAERYDLTTALYGQLPFGAVVSYASAAALTFASRYERRDAITAQGLGAGLLGASLMAAISAFGLPVCVEGMQESVNVLSHIDGRAPQWGERATMFWTDFERYGVFVGLVAAAGVGALILDNLLAGSIPDPSSAKPKQNEQTSTTYKRYARQLLANLLVSSTVMLGMALWSSVGNKEEK